MKTKVNFTNRRVFITNASFNISSKSLQQIAKQLLSVSRYATTESTKKQLYYPHLNSLLPY